MTMFAPYRRPADLEEKKDVFAPVADLMVGVVFIFIIMVLALSLLIIDDVKNAVPKSQYDQVVEDLNHARDQTNQVTAERDRAVEDLKRAGDQIAQLTAERDQARNVAQQQAERADLEQASRVRLAGFARYVRDTGVVPSLSRLAEADQRRTEILMKLKERLKAGSIQVDIDSENGTLRLPSTKLFESTKADPTSEGTEIIRTLGISIAEVVPCYLASSARPTSCPEANGAGILSAVYIEGHTDASPFKNTVDRFRNNWDLSAARAIEAFKIVSASDPRISGLRNGEGKALVGVSGYADTRPVHEGLSVQERMVDQIRETDRRIEVRLVMAVDKDEVQATLNDLRVRLEGLHADLK
jgi:chemotaxis protein MotB